jgi:hypothetical protein
MTTIMQISPDINYLYKVKKIFLIAILISYCAASLGISINYFYCCGKLKTVSLVAATEEKNCAGKSEKGCCKNKTITVKLKIDQKESIQETYHFGAELSTPVFFSTDYASGNIASNNSLNPLYKRPPPDNFPSRQALFSIFRI